MGFKGIGNLLHEALALEYVQGFLLSLPVFSAHYNKRFTGSPSHFERFMPANDLFYNAFKVISKFVYADCVHKATFMYRIAVRIYTGSPGKAKYSDSFSLGLRLH